MNNEGRNTFIYDRLFNSNPIVGRNFSTSKFSDFLDDSRKIEEAREKQEVQTAS